MKPLWQDAQSGNRNLPHIRIGAQSAGVGTPITSAAERAATGYLNRFLRGDQHLAAHMAAFLREAAE